MLKGVVGIAEFAAVFVDDSVPAVYFARGRSRKGQQVPRPFMWIV
jgi:hypothetical protein